MSLVIDLTEHQKVIQSAEREASALLRRFKAGIPPVVYTELQLKLCTIANESTRFFNTLGAMRMTGDLEQRPPAVTAESLELAACMPMVMAVGSAEEARAVGQARLVPVFPDHPIRDQSAAFALELQHIGDDTLAEEGAV